LLAIVLVLISTTNLGRWGLLLLTGILALLGWRELINRFSQKHGPMPISTSFSW
jgi:hypothetical protein